MFGSRDAQPSWLVFFIAGSTLFWSEIARAQSETIRIEYRADAACPSAEQFAANVLRRARKARLATAEESGRTFVVVIERQRGGFAGSLTIRDQGQLTVARKVEATGCNDVSGALALSTALAVDPTAPDPGGSDAEPPAGTQDEPSIDKAGDGKRSADGGAGAKPSGKEKPPTKPAEPTNYPDDYDSGWDGGIGRGPPGEWIFALGLGPELRSGSSPKVALGGAFSLDARPKGSPLGSLGAEFAFLSALRDSLDGATSSFQFMLGRPRICALLAEPSATLRLMPCLMGELGVVTAQGSQLPVSGSENRFWAAVAVPLRAELDVSKHLLLAFSAAPVFPLTRYHFVFLEPETTVYRVPFVSLALNLSLGVRL